ncbi:paraquat-inducible protein A [Parahaliea mediterranea]|uniref:Paraquat-inducible protein A n=1 Tax=Parahaliea mediterranea TaxID=651086 RepID=A0A939IN74_9GAMM|nr:paraquat-inducible protein A [Parahaliea mediterranea]MBN7798270.1 paraquat-inducible protein A [Parahaliea mediterranea]
MNRNRGLTALLLMALAIALLYPGVSQPVLTLTGTIEKSAVVNLGIELMAGDNADAQGRQMLTAISRFLGLDQIQGRVTVYDHTRSIWGTVEELARTGNLAVALLIVLFSLVIPVFKLLLQAIALAPASGALRQPLLRVNAALSKWSMADVFVMAMLVAYMAGRASGQMGDLLLMEARLEPGFWFFLAYCLFSIGASALIRREYANE